MPPPGEVTRLLQELRNGRREAFDLLFPVVYEELRVLARRQRRRSPSDTLNTTALVHEAYLKLTASRLGDWKDRRHFLAVAAKAMRQIAIDHARAVLASKRGGGAPHIPVDDLDPVVEMQASEVVALDEALARLAELSPNLGELVELRFFAGLTVEEAAKALDTSPRTVKREWRKARAFLYQALRGPSSGPDPAGGEASQP